MTITAAGRLRRRGAPCHIVAHRGYSSEFPENTLLAYEMAIRAGADVVEIDLRMSRDGTVVCHHDPATGGAELAALDLAQIGARGIPTLAEVLPALSGRTVLLFDLKRPDVELARDALALLTDHAMVAQAVLGVRSLEQARFVRQASADCVLLGFLQNYREFGDFYDIGGDIARVWEEDCDAATLAAVREGDHPVWVTAGRRADRPGDIGAARLRRLLDSDIDGILVNDPVQAIRVRDARGTAPQ